MFCTGEGGTGKSEIIKLATEFARLYFIVGDKKVTTVLFLLYLKLERQSLMLMVLLGRVLQIKEYLQRKKKIQRGKKYLMILREMLVLKLKELSI